MRRSRGFGGLAFQEERTRLRASEDNRPRDGWRLARAFGTQIWLRDADGYTARVWGRQLTPPWRYEVFGPAGLVADGNARCLAAAMKQAERMFASNDDTT